MSNMLDELSKRLLDGDERVLDELYQKHAAQCVRSLQTSYQVDKPLAEDCFMDALWLFRNKLMTGNLMNTNIAGYLFTTSKNVLLRRKRKELAYVALPRDNEGWDQNNFVNYLSDVKVSYDPLEKKEDEQSQESERKKRRLAIVSAFENLGAKCRQLLQMYLIDGVSLKDLQGQLGYSSYNAIKASKYQCKKTLLRKYHEQIQSS